MVFHQPTRADKGLSGSVLEAYWNYYTVDDGFREDSSSNGAVFDATGRQVLTVVSSPASYNRTLYAYDEAGRLSVQYYIDVDAYTGSKTAYTWGPNERLIAVVRWDIDPETGDVLAEQLAKRLDWHRDGEVVVDTFYPDDAGNEVLDSRNVYDRYGNSREFFTMNGEALKLSSSTRNEYDAGDRLVKKTVIDESGNMVSETRLSYDSYGRLIEETRLNSSGPENRSTFQYDQSGKEIEYRAFGRDGQENESRISTYDDAGKLAEQTYQSAYQWAVTRFEYDEYGNVLAARTYNVFNENGETTLFEAYGYTCVYTYGG